MDYGRFSRSRRRMVDETKKGYCKKCNIKAIPSKGFGNAYGKEDERGWKRLYEGHGTLIDCLKCPECGHSWVESERIEWRESIHGVDGYVSGVMRFDIEQVSADKFILYFDDAYEFKSMKEAKEKATSFLPLKN